MKINSKKLLTIIHELKKDVEGRSQDATVCIFHGKNSDGTEIEIKIGVTSVESDFFDNDTDEYICLS